LKKVWKYSTITVDEYIEAQLPEVRQVLNQVRETIRRMLPDAEERISWGMPTYRGRRNIIHFAAHKKHMGLYPGDKAIEYFAEKLSGAVSGMEYLRNGIYAIRSRYPYR
jgi:uncharacterized protein YdhG (YjbR/CyaY superfamily)